MRCANEFTVYISQSLVNQTVDSIENHVVKYPDEQKQRFDEPDHVRKIVKTEDVRSIRKSLERANKAHSDAVIVIFTNTTVTGQLSVWRYWWEPSTKEGEGWIESEYLFDFKDESYESIEVFDDYAIAYKDQVFTVLFYKEYLGTFMPENYKFKAYEWT